MKTKTETTIQTITDGHELPVKFEDGHEEQFIVKQLPVKLYPRAFAAFEAVDECEFLAIAFGKTKAQMESLTPESYEQVSQAFQFINAKGFFPYAGRRWAFVGMKMGVQTATSTLLPR